MKPEHKEAWIARLKTKPAWLDAAFVGKLEDGTICGCAIGQLLIAVPLPEQKMVVEFNPGYFMIAEDVFAGKLNSYARQYYGITAEQEREIESISDTECRNSWEPVIQYIEANL